MSTYFERDPSETSESEAPVEAPQNLTNPELPWWKPRRTAAGHWVTRLALIVGGVITAIMAVFFVILVVALGAGGTHQSPATGQTVSHALPTAAVPTAPPANASLPAPEVSPTSGFVTGYPAEPMKVLMALRDDYVYYFNGGDLKWLRAYWLQSNNPGVMDADQWALAHGQTYRAIGIGDELYSGLVHLQPAVVTWTGQYQFTVDTIVDPWSYQGNDPMEERLITIGYDPQQGRWGVLSSQMLRIVPFPTR